MLTLDFCKRFARHEIRVAAQIAAGFVALFGPSGAGKTTTLHCIAGLVTPDGGEISLNDRILYSAKHRINISSRDRGIGLIFQDSRLFPHLSVRDNLRFGAKNRSDRSFIDYDEIVDLLNLSGLLDRSPVNCSGGEKQRVAIGRALMAGPHLLLMDEPLGAIDLAERHRILPALRDLQRQHRLPVFYVTHDPSMVLNYADHMLVLDHGRIEQQGDPFTILRRLLSGKEETHFDNLLRGTVIDQDKDFLKVQVGQLELLTSSHHARIGETIYVQIPASEIILANDEPAGLSARNIFQGCITGWRQRNEIVYVELGWSEAESLVAEILPQTVSSLELQIGKKVYIIVKATGIRII